MAQEILVPVRRDGEMEETNRYAEETAWFEEIAWYAREVGSIVQYIFRACRNGPVLLPDSWVIALLK